MKAHGYSGKPLIKKLGIKAGYKIRLVNAPAHYDELIGDWPPDIQLLKDNREKANFVHLFAESVAEFETAFFQLMDEIEKDGMIWVSWYKKAAKIPTDLNENIIRNTALEVGLVDVKVCAVDAQWSGLKIVWRKENR